MLAFLFGVPAAMAAVPAVLLTLWIRKRASRKTPLPDRITLLWRIKRAAAFAATLLLVYACVLLVFAAALAVARFILLMSMMG